jgi:hypothetical protein
MENLTDPKKVEFFDDGSVAVQTEHGSHISRFNGEKWAHSYIDAMTGVFIGALDPKTCGGEENVAAMLRGEKDLPPKMSPVADIWYDLSQLRTLNTGTALDSLFRLDVKSIGALAQILWEALAMCAMAQAVETKQPTNGAAMVPWDNLSEGAKDNYRASVLEMMKFLAAGSECRLGIEGEQKDPPWRKHFPLANPAPAGYEAHMLHQIMTCPPLPRA